MTDITSSVPKGNNPPGSVRLGRQDEDILVPQDKPSEIPVSIFYKRFHRKDYNPDTTPASVTSPGELLGWTVTLDCWTFSTQIVLKISRDPRRLEIWQQDSEGAKKIGSIQLNPNDSWGEWHPPVSDGPDLPEEILTNWFTGQQRIKTQGWATNLGNYHQIQKGSEQRVRTPKPIPEGPHCSKCLKVDEGDLVDSNGVMYCMPCYIKGAT